MAATSMSATHLAAQFRAFNAVAAKLLVELTRMYPSDAVLRFLHTQLGEVTADRAKIHVPALNFFKEIRTPAWRSPGSPKGPATQCEYADLLLERDPAAFVDPIPVRMLSTCNVSAKYAAMTPEQRDAFWAYIGRLTQLASLAVLNASATGPAQAPLTC